MYPSLKIKVSFAVVFALALLGLTCSVLCRRPELSLASLVLLLSACFFAFLCHRHRLDVEAHMALVDVARKSIERRREAQHAVTSVLSEAAAPEEGMPEVLKAICCTFEWEVGLWWLLDPSEEFLSLSGIWQAPDKDRSNFVEASRKLHLPISTGLPGTSWARNEPVWLVDATVEANFPRGQVAAEAGLHAACAFPVVRGEKVLGVMEFFSPAMQSPDADMLEMFAAFGSQLGQFLERKQALAAVLEHARIAEFVADVSSKLAQSDPLPIILHNCCESIVTHLDAAFARIWTLNDKDNVLELQSSAGMYTHIDGAHARVPVGALKIGRIAEERLPHLSNSVLDDPRVGDREWARREGMVSFAGHPLILADEVVGVMAMFARKPLSDATLSALASVANSVAQTIRRKRSESALMVSESRLSSILNCMSEAVIVADTQGKLLLLNAAAQRMFPIDTELPPPEMWAESFSLYMSDMRTLFPPGQDPLARAIRGEQVDMTELYVQPPDSTGMWITTTASPLRSPEGLLIGGLVVTRDVTERKAAERRVSEFYSTVSHELRTPLTSIRASLGLIEGGLTEELQPTAMELVEIARSECDRLIRLVNDILDMKKIEAGRLELILSSLDPEKLVLRTVEALHGFAGESRVSLKTDVKSQHPVTGDRDRILQVLTNLVSNAVKFSLPESEVLIAVEQVPGRHLRFSVHDRGPGIAGKDVKKLFTQFQQLDSSDTRPKGGTGLGLAIARSIIEAHGGTIGVESQPGQGAMFWFELPMVTVRAAETTVPGSPKVLIVDDDPPTRAVIAQMLRGLEVECLEAENGEQALSLCASDNPDLIILDLILPGMSGFDVVEQLRPSKSGQVPLLIYSAHEAMASERERLRLGATRYLTKARSSDGEFMESVRDLLGERPRELKALLTPPP